MPCSSRTRRCRYAAARQGAGRQQPQRRLLGFLLPHRRATEVAKLAEPASGERTVYVLRRRHAEAADRQGRRHRRQLDRGRRRAAQGRERRSSPDRRRQDRDGHAGRCERMPPRSSSSKGSSAATDRRGTGARARRRGHRDRGGRVRRHHGAERLGQVDRHEHHRLPRRADRRPLPFPRRRRRRARPAASAPSSGATISASSSRASTCSPAPRRSRTSSCR